MSRLILSCSIALLQTVLLGKKAFLCLFMCQNLPKIVRKCQQETPSFQIILHVRSGARGSTYYRILFGCLLLTVYSYKNQNIISIMYCFMRWFKLSYQRRYYLLILYKIKIFHSEIWMLFWSIVLKLQWCISMHFIRVYIYRYENSIELQLVVSVSWRLKFVHMWPRKLSCKFLNKYTFEI